MAHCISKFSSLLIHWAGTLDQHHSSAAAACFSLAFNSSVSSSSAPSNTSPCWGSLPPLTDPYWQTGHSTCFFSLHKVGSNIFCLKTAHKPTSSTFIKFVSSVPFGVSPSTHVQGGSFGWPMIYHHLSLLSFHNCLHLFSFTVSSTTSLLHLFYNQSQIQAWEIFCFESGCI